MEGNRKSNLVHKISELKGCLPSKQKIFCEFLLKNYRSIGLDSASEMAAKSSVGTTTVMRTIKNLGFKNIDEFRKEIHAVVLDSQITKWWDFSNLSEEEKGIESIWSEINSLQSLTIDKNLVEAIIKAVDMIQQCNTAHVFGLRTSRVSALYLENAINQFYPKINQLSYDPYFVIDKLFHFKSNDILILIALSPFTQLTLEAAKYGCELGHPIILITDDQNNSLNPFATIVLNTIRSQSHYTMVPVISLIETITVVLGRRLKISTEKSLKEIGELLVRKGITTI